MKEILIDLINDALKKMDITNASIEIEQPKIKENGDYSSNIALKLTKILNQNPMDIANNIVANINSNKIKKIEIKKPGFINFFVDKNYLIDNLVTVLKEEDCYGSSNIGNGKKINIEFVSANPTGILHIGNARGGAYGDSLARILRFCNYSVTEEYYINDAGNQIIYLGESLKSRYFEKCNKNYPMPEEGYHGKEIIDMANDLYNEFQDKLLEKDIDYFKEYATKILLNNIFNDLKEYRINYDVYTSELAIKNKYNLYEIIDRLTKNGYTYERDGAVWFKCSSIFDNTDHVLIKEDKTLTYLVPDIAYHLDKYNRGFDKMIDIFGTDHHGYVARLKSSIKALGNDPDKLEVKLLQLVRLIEDGNVVKMSKRTGKSVTLKELIDEVGVNAARYYFVKSSLDTQMDFDLNLAKSKSNENPVYYVCYAYARIASILKEVNYDEILTKYDTLNDEDTYNVLEKVYEFKEVVKNAAKKELPHLITNYVYDLANIFHNYYSNVRIITEDEKATKEKIMLIKAVQQTIKNALNLIGVIPPEKM